ncbi:Luciferase-like monooxygenase [Micromonospora purpureochromogenes]|uniref:Luciferase-like monooxygenase n=1 Tax=Micromonospora purpureochromogenes TaxID=47872 RepID=A0A1C4VXW0_9ACTN|nr:LLM class flavin-dependent oxidoreductase [Micromonospora purpureochromogenes]SCE88788.1 Luciferase-like monooxygenase [Micromonospora purpureochromogenes]
MTDYGHPITFGLSLDPSAHELDATRQLAQAADDGGLDYLAVQDHPYQPGHLDTWTMISHLAARTSRINFLTDVADLQLRPPTMLAKAGASLGVLTGGRIVLGVGGGASADAVAAMGGTRRTGGDTVAYTTEALQIMRRALAGDVVRFAGAHLAVEGYRGGPVPPAPVPLWLGGQRPRMLTVAGRHSDGWISPLNIYVPPEEVPSRQQIIDEAARAAGRDPAVVRRIYNVIGTIGGSGGPGGTGLVGDAQLWVDTLTRWAVDLGFDTFIFWPTASPRSQLRAFTERVVPAVREQVREFRGQR